MTHPSDAKPQSMRWPGEAAFWFVIALVLAASQLPSQQWRPRMTDDSFQYLSTARQIRIHHQVATSLIHFDTERSSGSLPAPLTWFPPGYPLLIAAIPAAPETAALLISLASFAFVAWGIWSLCRAVHASPWTARAAVLCWVTNCYVLSFGVSALSESLFTAAAFASMWLLVRAGRQVTCWRDALPWILSAAFVGLSYWIRYAGVLYVAAWIFVALWSINIRDRRSWTFAVLPGLAVIAGFLSPVMVRNVLLVGDWRGGNNTHIQRPLLQILTELPRVLHHLILGDAPISALLLPLLAMVSFLTILGGLAAIAWFRAPGAADGSSVLRKMPTLRNILFGAQWRAWKVIVGVLLVYGAGIAVVALRSPISFEPRMYLPAFPFLIVLASCAIAAVFRCLPLGAYSRIGFLLAAGSLMGYAAGNFVSRQSVGPDSVQATKTMLEEQASGTTETILALLKRELPPGEVIAGTNGQAVGYILGHPTLSLVGRPFSLRLWDEQALRSELGRYGCGHLLIFRNDEVVGQSRFLQELARGQTPPWLSLVAHSPNVHVYRMGERGKP